MNKKIIFLSLLFLISVAKAQSQVWLDIGIKGAGNISYFNNPNVMNDRQVKIIMPGTGYEAGVKAGLNFSPEIEVTVDCIYSTFNQKYEDNLKTEDWQEKVSASYIDVPLLFHHNKEGSYVEIGPQYSFLMSGNRTLSSYSTPGFDYKISKNGFTSSGFSAVFGFGGFIAGGDNTMLAIGVRIAYRFYDVYNNGAGYPFPEYPGSTAYTGNTGHKQTNIISISIFAEINHDLGYLARGKGCNHKRFYLF